MVPPKGWRARAAVARARRAPPARDEALIRAERARIYAERDAAIAAMVEAERSTGPKGPVTAADMLKPAAPVIEGVTPDDDESAPAPAIADVTEDEDEAPAAAEPAPAPETDAPAPEAPESAPEAVTEPPSAPPAAAEAPAPAKKAAKAPTKKS